jgi:hypothetical protein
VRAAAAASAKDDRAFMIESEFTLRPFILRAVSATLFPLTPAMSATFERPARIKKEKVAWHLPGDVLAFLEEASIRLDLSKAWIMAAIIRERLPTLRTRPVQRYAMAETPDCKPVKEAKNRMKQTLTEFGN